MKKLETLAIAAFLTATAVHANAQTAASPAVSQPRSHTALQKSRPPLSILINENDAENAPTRKSKLTAGIGSAPVGLESNRPPPSIPINANDAEHAPTRSAQPPVAAPTSLSSPASR